MNVKLLQAESEKLQKMKKEWEDQRIEMGGDEKVIRFISDILFHGVGGVSTEDSVETIRNLFEAGYCYHLAKMLQDAFPGGQECLCYPYGHIVYVYQGVAYDINGVSDAEYEMYIPVSALGRAINDFKHVPGLEYNISHGEVEEIGEKCRRKNLCVHAVSAYDKDVVGRSRAVCEITPDSRYVRDKANYGLEKNRLLKNLNDGCITKEQFDKYMEEYCLKNGLSYPIIQRTEKELATLQAF